VSKFDFNLSKHNSIDDETHRREILGLTYHYKKSENIRKDERFNISLIEAFPEAGNRCMAGFLKF